MLATKAKIIEDAANLVGRETLAKELDVSAEELQRWIDGHADVSGSTFTRLSAFLVKLASKGGKP